MSSRFIRPSKYRHVFAQPAKKENWIDNVKASGSAWDTNIVAASGKFISVNWSASGGGAFAILPIPSPWTGTPAGFPAKLPEIIPLARQHTAPVLDTAWSPFDDNLVASGGEDGNVFIWKVSDDAFEGWGAETWTPIDFDPVASINVSARKVGQVIFHPTANHVVATATGDYLVKLWDLGNTDTPRSVLSGHGDTIQSMAFNHDGSLVVTTCRDRRLRIFDSRTGSDAVRVADGHPGVKGARVTWMGGRDNIATTGFSKMSDREVAIWETGSLSVVKRLSIDQSAGVVMPYYSDNSILFLAGKGDGNIRYYEWESDTLHALAEHKSSEPQRGMCFLPRRALNVSECEIARAFKLTTSAIESIAFIVPRKSSGTFQSDIYPPAPAAEPALTAGEFFTGKVAAPKQFDFATASVLSSPVPPPTKTTTAASPAAPPSISPPIQFSTSSVVPKGVNSEVPLSSPPAVTVAPVLANEESHSNGNPSTSAKDDSTSASLREENAQLNQDLRDARAQIRELELQVETLRNNAQKAAKALLG